MSDKMEAEELYRNLENSGKKFDVSYSRGTICQMETTGACAAVVVVAERIKDGSKVGLKVEADLFGVSVDFQLMLKQIASSLMEATISGIIRSGTGDSTEKINQARYTYLQAFGNGLYSSETPTENNNVH